MELKGLDMIDVLLSHRLKLSISEWSRTSPKLLTFVGPTSYAIKRLGVSGMNVAVPFPTQKSGLGMGLYTCDMWSGNGITS